MKVLFVFLGLLAASYAALVPAVETRDTCELQGHLRDLLGLIKQDDIALVLYNHLDDPDFQQVLIFIFSAEFRQLYLDISEVPEIIEFLQWLENQCVNVRGVLNSIRDYLGLPAVPWNQVNNRNGVASFWDDLKAVIPLIEIRLLAEDKYQNYLVFEDFIDRIRSPEAERLFVQLSDNPTYQNAIQQLQANGIDVPYIREVLSALLGWG